MEYKTRLGGTSHVFKQFIDEYNRNKDVPLDELNLDGNFSVLRAENWQYYLDYFRCDAVILVGKPDNFYKAYCIDTQSKKALFFNLKTNNNDLNDIPMVDVDRIYIGELSRRETVSASVTLLKQCAFRDGDQPNKYIYDALLSLLTRQV